MSISNITSNLSALFPQTQASSTPSSQAGSSSTASASSTTAATDGQTSDPAYQLALGQQANRNSLLGYNQLGKLVRQAGDALADVGRSETAVNALAVDGQGRPLVSTHVDAIDQDRTVTAAGTLVDTVNALLKGADQTTADQTTAGQTTAGQTAAGQTAAGQGDPASALSSALQTILARDFSGAGRFSKLAEIGLSTGKDGTLQLDTTQLEKAYASDPHATRALLAQAANALRDTLTAPGANAIGGQIATRMGMLTQSLTQTPSLLDTLNASSDGSDGSDSSGGLTTPSLSPAAASRLPSGYASYLASGSTSSAASSAAASYAASGGLDSTAQGASPLSMLI